MGFYLLSQKQNNMIELSIDHHHQQSDKDEENEQEEEDDEVVNLDHIPCHPHRPVQNFDFSAIQEQIIKIRRRKEAAKQAARRAKKVPRNRDQIYQSDIIEETLEESRDLLQEHISVSLQHRVRFIEDKVYMSAQNDTFGDFVTRIKEQILPNESLANELNLVMSGVEASIHNDIEEGDYEIHRVEKKRKVIPMEPLPAHRVKLKNMMIKSKIVDLREEMNKSDVGADALLNVSNDTSPRAARQEGEVWGDQFHIMSEGTKKATQFVKRIKKEQIQARKEKAKKANQMKSLEVKSAMEHKQFEQQMKKERHESLKQRYVEGRQQKKAEKQRQQEKQKEFASYVKEYRGKRPLFKVKEQQYLHNVVEQQEKKRKMQLEQIHSTRKPVTREELLEHQKHYQKVKDEKMDQLNAERDMRKKEKDNLPRKSFYRGRYHSIIKQEKEERKNEPDPNLTRDELLKKQKQFAEFVRKKYAPHVDDSKKKKLQEMIKTLETQGARKGLSDQEEKKLGNEYLKQMHKMIEQMRAKGLLQSKVVVQENEKRKDYMKDVRDRYNFSTIDYSSQVGKNSEWVQNVAMKREADARQKEKLLKLGKHSNDIDRYMRDIEDINDDYINSAEAKMSLIKKFEGRGGRRSLVDSSRTSELS